MSILWRNGVGSEFWQGKVHIFHSVLLIHSHMQFCPECVPLEVGLEALLLFHGLIHLDLVSELSWYTGLYCLTLSIYKPAVMSCAGQHANTYESEALGPEELAHCTYRVRVDQGCRVTSRVNMILTGVHSTLFLL